MPRVLLLEVLSPADGNKLYTALLVHQAACAGREDEVYESNYRKATRDDLVDTESFIGTFRRESTTCTWCMGTGRYCGNVPCLFCDATGQRPTQRGFRIMREQLGSRASDMRKRLAMYREHEATLQVMDQEEWTDWVAALPDHAKAHEFTHEYIEDQIAWITGMIVETEEMLVGVERAQESVDELDSLCRIAERAVKVRVETVEKRVGVVVTGRVPCADCGKPAYMASDGIAYCKRHAHSRGLLTTPDPDPVPTPDPPQSVDDSGNEGASRLRMTRPFRFIDGPLAGELHPVPRGETQVTIGTHVYERRGHHFEYRGEA